MRVVFSGLKARGVAKLSVFKIMDFLWISVTKGKIYSFWIYGKAPMYYYIEAYILIFLTYTLWLAANQDWTGHLTLTMGALYLLSYRGDLIFINILWEKTRKSQIFSCFSLHESFLMMLEGRVHQGERGDNLVRWSLLLRSESW